MRVLKTLKLNILLMLVLAICMLVGVSSAAIDPLYIGVGARPLGMGKAYVAVAEDGDTIFLNPAGLGRTKVPKITSMYTELMGDARYVVLGAIYPYIPVGAIGGGMISTNVSDIALYDGGGNPLGEADYGNNVFFLSYGLDLAEDLNIEVLKNVQVGANLKYFSQGGSGDVSMEAATGNGIDMDFGILYTPIPWLSLGYNHTNFLPTKVFFKETGIAEDIPAIAKFGGKVSIIGKNGLFTRQAIYGKGYQKLNLALDIDAPTDDPVSGSGHIGLEYYPIESFALRIGIDQDPGAEEVVSNLTAGVGLRFDGIEFNYAYHPYDAVVDNTTHFFSISYVGHEEEESAPAEENDLELIEPEDKTITREDKIDVSGKIYGYSEDTELQVNGVDLYPAEDGSFSSKLKFQGYGKKLIRAAATDADGNVIEKKARVLRLISFSDVQGDYWSRMPIEYSGTVGLVEGYPDGTFRPERALSRAELATLLVRARGIELPPISDSRTFSDVKKAHWAARYIDAAEQMGLIKGYPDGTFRPNQKISRAEGILVLARFEGLRNPEQGEMVFDPYDDVPIKHWAAGMIHAAKEAEFLDYVKSNNLKPNDPFPRSEAVYILSKTTYAKEKIEWLLNWDVGFEDEEMEKHEFEMIRFKDVPESYWAVKPIEELATAGIISGYPDGTFKPNKTLTRAELSTMLVKARGIKLPILRSAPFKDVPKAHWAALYIQAAVDLGMVQGYPNGTFKPNASVNRAEAITVIDRFDAVHIPQILEARPFPDVNMDHWAARFITAGKNAGILEYLKGNNFEPERLISRAEAAEMLSRTKFGRGQIDEMYSGKESDPLKKN